MRPCKNVEPERTVRITIDQEGLIRIMFAEPMWWVSLSPGNAMVLAVRLAKYAGARRVEIEF